MLIHKRNRNKIHAIKAKDERAKFLCEERYKLKKTDDVKKNDNTKESKKNAKQYLKYGSMALGAVVVAILLILLLGNSTEHIAKIGDEKITVSEFNFFFHQIKLNMLQEAGLEPETPEAETFWNTTKFEGEDATEYAKKRALEDAKEFKVQLIKAKEEGIKLSKETIESIDQNLKQFQTQFDSKREAEADFKKVMGINFREAKSIYRDISLTQEYSQRIFKDIKVNDDEAEVYIDKYPQFFTDTQFRINGEEAVWARHILIEGPDFMPPSLDDEIGEIEYTEEELKARDEVWEQARIKGQNILDMIDRGEDFEELVKEYSDDGTSQTGGDYVFGRNQMVPEFEKAAFDELNPGEISGLVKTDFGYHIIKLIERIPEGAPVSAKCAQEYREFGTYSLQMAKFEEKMEELKSQYTLELNEEVFNSL